MKRCCRCKEWKNRSEFAKARHYKDGLRYQCKACDKECRAAYLAANPDKNRERVRRWREQNKEKDKEISKRWRLNNLEYVREKIREWEAKNRDKKNVIGRRYYWAHVEENREKTRAWKAANAEKVRQNNRNRKARKKSAEGKITAAEWRALKEKYNHTCLKCGRREPDITLTLDHVVPLLLGGKNVIENAQPLCGPCNSSKNARHIDYRPWWEGRLF